MSYVDQPLASLLAEFAETLAARALIALTFPDDVRSIHALVDQIRSPATSPGSLILPCVQLAKRLKRKGASGVASDIAGRLRRHVPPRPAPGARSTHQRDAESISKWGPNYEYMTFGDAMELRPASRADLEAVLDVVLEVFDQPQIDTSPFSSIVVEGYEVHVRIDTAALAQALLAGTEALGGNRTRAEQSTSPSVSTAVTEGLSHVSLVLRNHVSSPTEASEIGLEQERALILALARLANAPSPTTAAVSHPSSSLGALTEALSIYLASRPENSWSHLVVAERAAAQDAQGLLLNAVITALSADSPTFPQE